MVESSHSTPLDMGKGSAVKPTSAVLKSERRIRKLARLEREAKVAEQKAQKLKWALETEARKRAKTLKTMRSYFTSIRNSLNCGPLDCAAQEVETSLDVEGSQSVDTEVLLSCPTVVLVSDDEEASAHLEDNPDLSADDMVNNEAFMDLPSHGGKKRKSGNFGSKSGKDAGGSTTATLKKLKKNYNLHRKFQCDWATKEPWSEAVLAEDGVMHYGAWQTCANGAKIGHNLGNMGVEKSIRSVWTCMQLVDLLL